MSPLADADRDFIRKFEALQVPLAEFKHWDHVRLAWAYLAESPLPEALIRFRDALKRFAGHHGKDGLYHETVTFAFLLIIHGKLVAEEPEEGARSWAAFAARNRALLEDGKAELLKWYREETLASPHARRVYVLPDRR